MINQYDFLNLSYVEFEELCRDLLGALLDVQLESFTEGGDGGIDLRYLGSKGRKVIVQCKRYATYKDLYATLKKEKNTALKFAIASYRIATSVGLTPAQKQKIVELLSPALKSPADILTKKDLNALLRQYPEIEKRHFKLWIQSTAVLEKIFKSKVINQSHFEMEQIRELLKVYVVNPSFDEAETILERDRFVVISGIPGIGKTTLARVLAYTYLSRKKYDEFVYLSDSINEGYEHFKEGVKQVFLFDDFLGQSFEDRTLDRNEDKRIMEFIRKIHRTNDKILLFTTREYILRDVQLRNDLLADPSIDFAKCLIDLSSYTRLIKAKILYNHLFFSGLPHSHLQAFAAPEVYKTIIEHDNYSPRIIETLIRQEQLQLTDPAHFTQTIIAALDNPFKIWEMPFTSQINDLSRWLLTVLLTMGSPVLLNDLRDACQAFARVHGTRYFPEFTHATFLKSIKELEDSFIISRKDNRGNRAVEFQNPSVQDFLLHYFFTNKDQLLPVLEAAIFQEQFFAIFDSSETNETFRYSIGVARRVVRDDAISELTLERIMEPDATWKSCTLSRYTSQDSNPIYFRRPMEAYQLLQLLHAQFHDTAYAGRVKDYITSQLQIMVDLPEGHISIREVESYISLLKYYHGDILCEPIAILTQLSEKMNTLHYYSHYFKNMDSVFPDAYQDFINEEDFTQKLYDLAASEISDKDNDKEELVSTLESVQYEYGLDLSDEIKQLGSPDPDLYDDDARDERFDYANDQKSEDQEIDSIFSSLRSED